jgi:hypothetical protein
LWFSSKHRVCFERKERENRGSVLEKGEKGGGYGQNNHLLPPLPHDTEQRSGWTRRPVGGGRGAGDPVHGDSREVGQNEEELEGNRFRSLPWSGTGGGGGSAASGGGQLWRSVVLVLKGLGGREAQLGWCVARWGAGPALL